MANATGSPADGAYVLAYALPTPDSLGSLKVGDQEPDVLVGQTTTDALGAYELPTPSVDLTQEELADGSVNFLVNAFTTTGYMTSYTFNAIPNMLNGGIELNTLNLAYSPTQTPPKPDSETDAPESPDLAQCGSEVVNSFSSEATVVAGTYSAVPYATAAVKYEQSTKSSISTALSVTGEAGSFHDGGSTSDTIAGTVPFPKETGDKAVWYATYFGYPETAETCGGPNTGQKLTTTDYMVKVGQLNGGDDENTSAPYPTGEEFCVPTSGRGGYSKKSGSSQTFTEGVNIPEIGVSLSTSTQYGTTSEVSMSWTKAAEYCGQNSYPLNTDPAPGAILVQAVGAGQGVCLPNATAALPDINIPEPC